MSGANWLQAVALVVGVVVVDAPARAVPGAACSAADPRPATASSCRSSARIYRVARGRSRARAAVERLRALAARVQRRLGRRPLPAPARPGRAAAEPDGRRRRAARARLQHRGQLRHEHELAELRRRVDDEPPHPDGRADGAELRLRGRRHRGRGRARPRARRGAGRETIGNFWVDLTRVDDARAAAARARVRARARRARASSRAARLRATRTPSRARRRRSTGGPVASQEAIKELGTNGGGIVNANSAHPFENPTGFTNLLEIWALLAIPFALTYTFGRLVGDQRQGWAVFAAMFVLWIGSAALATRFEVDGNPKLDARRREPRAGEHGGQGGALRRRRVRALRRLDDRHVDRRGERHARQLHAARRRRAARRT